MTPAGLPPTYPRRAAAPQACLAESGSRRFVQRRHCLYTVSQCPRRAVIWCRPVSPAATAWMRAQGFDVRRTTCTWEEVGPFIDRQEASIEGAKAVKALLRPVAGEGGWIKAIRRRP